MLFLARVCVCVSMEDVVVVLSGSSMALFAAIAEAHQNSCSWFFFLILLSFLMMFWFFLSLFAVAVAAATDDVSRWFLLYHTISSVIPRGCHPQSKRGVPGSCPVLWSGGVLLSFAMMMIPSFLPAAVVPFPRVTSQSVAAAVLVKKTTKTDHPVL